MWNLNKINYNKTTHRRRNQVYNDQRWENWIKVIKRYKHLVNKY